MTQIPRLWALLLFLLPMTLNSSAQLPLEPDFAFPKKVMKDAEAAYARSTGLERMQAAMQIAAAQTAIDPDSAYAMPDFIAATARKENDPTAGGLLTLYRARLLADIYRANRYKYDKVEAPALPLPDDVAQWSGEQFRTRISELTDSAMTLLAPAYRTPISDYNNVINSPAESRRYYPTLHDFAVLTAIDLYNTADNDAQATATGLAVLESTPEGSMHRAVWLVKTSDNNKLWAAYEAAPRGETAGYILYHLSDIPGHDVVKAMREYLAGKPQGEVAEAVESKYRHMTRPEASFSSESTAGPGQEITVEVKYKYTSQVGLTIYRINNPLADQRNRNLKKVAEYTVATDSLNKGNASIAITIDTEGWYVLRPTVNGVIADNPWQDMTLQVTPFIPFTLSSGGRNAAILTRYADGAPVAGATLSLYSKNNSTSHTIGETGTDGVLMFDIPKALNSKHGGYHPLGATVGGKKYFFGSNVGVSQWRPYVRKGYVDANFYLDRPIYRPGEKMDWSLTAVRIDPKAKTSVLATRQAIRVVISDVNYENIDTIDITTDAYGRANGSFTIPEGRLTGRYRLSAYVGKSVITGTSFMVSDFKAPVFEVTDVKAVRQADSTHSITITGVARTYAGMPVADAEVAVSIKEMPRWRWWWNPAHDVSDGIATATGKTDAEGNFSVVVNGESLDTDEDYSAIVTVTTAAAETATANTHFTTGKPYALTAGGGSLEYCSDQQIVLPVKAYGPDGEPTDMNVAWRLTAGETVLEGNGKVTANGLSIDLPDAPAAMYDIKVTPADTALCDILTVEKGAALYSIKRNLVPESTSMLLPKHQIDINDGDVAEIMLGVPRDSYIYIYTKSSEEERLSDVRMAHLKAGFNTIRLTAGHDSQNTVIALLCVHDGKSFTETVELLRRDTEAIELKAESWRDRLVPGSTETWRFTLTRADGKAMAGAMLATMYNHALDALGTSLYWPAQLPKFVNHSYVDSNTINRWPASTRFWLNVTGKDVRLNIEQPTFRYLPEGIARMLTGMVYGSAVMKSSARAAVVNDMMEVAEDESAQESSSADGAMLNDVVTVAYGSSDRSESDDAKPAEEFSFRPGEILQAFWLPDITINDRGEAEITFSTPEAIGAWRFNAIAWNESLRSSILTHDFVTSKPLMVQSNAPRFLRGGDHAQIIDTVYNNTGDTATVASHIEFFDIATGRVIATHDTSSEIAPNASAQTAAWIDVPADMPILGYRVKSTDGEFSDGEQTAIPILESGATVIDTENFVLTAEKPQFTTTLPENTSITALQYCQNPVWDVVRALPDLLADIKPQSSPQAAQLVYSALTAQGMSRQFPEIKQVINTWSSNTSDSTLVSDLLKNEDIKLALLAQTPWLSAAASQTERMARLKAVFDERESATALSRALKALRNLRRPDSGFAWGTWSDESSLWATQEVAWGIGHAKAQGYLPESSEAAKMAESALRFIDANIKEHDGTGYALLLSFYPGYEPTTIKAKKAVAEAVQVILKNWRKASTADKARYALILESRGYHAVAAEIMRSVREFATTDAYGVTSFPSVRSAYDYTFILQAFARIAPDDALLDSMRRWLVLRTQVSDDLGTLYPTPLIAAVLASGSKWTALSSGTATISIGNETLVPDKAEYATGAIDRRLSQADAGKTITVTRHANAPVSYGSITSVSKRQAEKVKPASCRDIAIEKRLLVERDGKWETTDDLKLGERTRVQLLITVKRDLDYVTVNDERAAALEPVDQLPGYVYASGLAFYRENSDSRTRLFISRLPKGTYYLTYDMTAALTGTFASGIATAQSQYAPEVVAHSGGTRLVVDSAR